jgi:hypothetical protein
MRPTCSNSNGAATAARTAGYLHTHKAAPLPPSCLGVNCREGPEVVLLILVQRRVECTEGGRRYVRDVGLMVGDLRDPHKAASHARFHTARHLPPSTTVPGTHAATHAHITATTPCRFSLSPALPTDFLLRLPRG